MLHLVVDEAENGQKLRLGLQVGLQSGVTFLEKWGYTFGVFGGLIEGEGKGKQIAIGRGKMPVRDIGKIRPDVVRMP